MIKTFLRRWWILNRLFHFSKHFFGMVAPVDHFLEWMVGLDISIRVPPWYRGKTQIGRFHRWLTWKLYNSSAARKHEVLPGPQMTELKNLISECVQQKLINMPSGNNIELSPVGLEQYSVTYLIFGHDYAKKIWTGIIVGLVVWYATDRIQDTIPQTLKIEYIPTQQIPLFPQAPAATSSFP